MYSIEETFNVIWRVSKPRSPLIAFLIYWGVLTLAPLLISLGIAASAYFYSLPLVSHTTEWLGMEKVLATLTAFLLSSFGFTLLYTVMPHCDVSLKHSIPGGMIAAILFEFAKQGFTFYISWIPTYQLLYGALAAIPLFLIWLYVSWLIILFGAEVTHALDKGVKF